MDRIPDLSAFQGVLLSADNQYSFSKLKFRGGNEDKIKYVVNKLFHFLKEKNYITESGAVQEKHEEYRKLALYLVLNADLPALEDMTELPGAEALVWTLPTLPGTLLCELFRGLHMRPHLYRMVAFCRPALALQLADAFLAELQHAGPAPDLEHSACLASALYRLLCRLPWLRAPAAAPAAALAGLRVCLASLTAAPPPSASVDDRHRLLARALAATLRLIRTCFARFVSVQRFEDEDFADVYLATHDPADLVPQPLDFKICDCPDREISESLRACNALLLDRCAALVMNVSVDAFCAWSEYEEDGSDVQRIVGELCHETIVTLRGAPDAADHRLPNMLEQIAVRPLDPEDVIDATDPDEIAARIRTRGPGAAAWLAALLRRPALWRDPRLLESLRSEAETLDEEQSARLFDGIVAERHGSDPGDEADAVRRAVAIEAFRRCGDPVKDRILGEQFRDVLHDELATVEFEAALTETFNRLTAGGAGPGDALAAFVQNPGRTLERVARAAGDGAAQAELMLRIVERLGAGRLGCYAGESRPALVRALGAALDDAAAAGSDARRDRLARFVTHLAAAGLLPGDALLRHLVLPRLQGGGGGGGRALRGAATLLRGVAGPPAPPPGPRAVLLAVVAQALDATLVPDADAAAARDELLGLLDDVLPAYLERIPERELRWLRGRVSRASPLTRARCAALWPARPPPTLAAEIREHPADILLLSTREWDVLLPRGADEQTLARVRTAMRHASRVRHAPAARACLHRGHAAAMRRVQNNYLSANPTETQAENVTSFILAVAGAEPELAAIWAPLLAHLAAAPPIRSIVVARLAAHHAAGARHLLAHVQSLVA